jgi:hypothetical protein
VARPRALGPFRIAESIAYSSQGASAAGRGSPNYPCLHFLLPKNLPRIRGHLALKLR